MPLPSLLWRIAADPTPKPIADRTARPPLQQRPLSSAAVEGLSLSCCLGGSRVSQLSCLRGAFDFRLVSSSQIQQQAAGLPRPVTTRVSSSCPPSPPPSRRRGRFVRACSADPLASHHDGRRWERLLLVIGACPYLPACECASLTANCPCCRGEIRDLRTRAHLTPNASRNSSPRRNRFQCCSRRQRAGFLRAPSRLCLARRPPSGRAVVFRCGVCCVFVWASSPDPPHPPARAYPQTKDAPRRACCARPAGLGIDAHSTGSRGEVISSMGARENNSHAVFCGGSKTHNCMCRENG